ncbi:hypothetical protein LguiA_017135 [Lonicera macranthoides]
MQLFFSFIKSPQSPYRSITVASFADPPPHLRRSSRAKLCPFSTNLPWARPPTMPSSTSEEDNPQYRTIRFICVLF